MLRKFQFVATSVWKSVSEICELQLSWKKTSEKRKNTESQALNKPQGYPNLSERENKDYKDYYRCFKSVLTSSFTLKSSSG